MIKVLYGLGLFFGLFMNPKNAPVEKPSPYTHLADSLLKYVNKKAVSSGILYDRVAPFARLDAFQPAKDTSGYQHFRQAYSELYMSHYHPEGKLIAPDDVDDIVAWRRYQQRIPLGIMDMQYQRLDPDALRKKAFFMKSGRLYDNPAGKVSPFATRRLQVAALMEDKLQPGPAVIKLYPELFLHNTGTGLEEVKLEFSNGLGTHHLFAGNDSVIVDLPADALVYLKTSVRLKDGTVFNSSSVIEVAEGTSQNNLRMAKLPTGPCFKDTVSASIGFEGYDEMKALKGQVELNYYYRTGRNDLEGCRKKLAKPIIVLDGFDPTDKRDANFIYNYNFHYYNQEGKASNFADELRMQGYDVVIVNMPRYQIGTRNIVLPGGQNLEIGMLMLAGGDYIERNAMALVKVLENIRAELRQQGSQEQVVIVGPSMGGLISRYALGYMEKHGMDHNCRLWFSWDATHLGSNLPIGEQYFIRSIAQLGLRGAKDGIAQQINTPASKQELNHHHLASAAEPEGAPGFKDRFYTALNHIGFPQHCRKIAMISGAINGQIQPEGTAGETAFDFKLKMNKKPRLLLFNVLGLATNPNFINAKIHFAPAMKDGTAKSEVYRMKLMGLPVHRDYATPFPNASNSLDLIPGGWYPGFKEIRDSTRTKMKGFFNWMLDPQFLNVVENHSHQPSINTLGFGLGPHPNANRKWDDDLSQINFNCGSEKEIPWDAWYAPEINLRHDSLTYEYVWRMLDEIKGKHIPQPKPTRQLQVFGDTSLMLPGEIRRFAVASNDQTARFHWSSSNPQLDIIGGQGTDTIMVKYMGSIGGICTLSCTGEGACYQYTATGLLLSRFDQVASGFYTKTDVRQQTGTVTISLPAPAAAATSYQLVDAQGRVLATQGATATGKLDFEMQHLQKPSVYVIRSMNGSLVLTENKMILQ